MIVPKKARQHQHPIHKHFDKDTWLAQLKEHVTLDLQVVGQSPTWGVEIT